MNNFIRSQNNQSHIFVFNGKGTTYFIICLANLCLSIITLGIYTPWAVVKCRRYIYQNMTLNGQPFVYKATGGAIFVSFLLLMMIYIVSVYLVAHGSHVLGFTLLGLLMMSIPLMAIKSLQYQAMMTSLNGVRFGFECSKLQAWLSMLLLPVLLTLVSWGVVYLLWLATEWLEGSTGFAFRVILMALAGVVGMGATYGITYGKWMQLIGNGANFGIHGFAIKVNLKACIMDCVKSSLSFLPFIVVSGYLIAPIFLQMVMFSMTGVDDNAFLLEHKSRITACYVLYFLGVMVFVSNLYVTIRNLFLNNLMLAKGNITFHSSVTAHGMLLRLLTVIFISGITLGLAYPWMKMWLVAWLASNTHVRGDLDSLALTNTDTELQTGPAMWVSRGVMAYFPLI